MLWLDRGSDGSGSVKWLVQCSVRLLMREKGSHVISRRGMETAALGTSLPLSSFLKTADSYRSHSPTTTSQKWTSYN